jgi:hypothetical protein
MASRERTPTDSQNFAIDNVYQAGRLLGSEVEMTYIESAGPARIRTTTAPKANSKRVGAVAYTAFTLSLGFAAAVVLGLIH